jgi:hypothetical protein
MREVSSRNNGFYLSRVVCSGDVALQQSYLAFRLITAMLLPLGAIWLNSVLVVSSPVLKFMTISNGDTPLIIIFNCLKFRSRP